MVRRRFLAALLTFGLVVSAAPSPPARAAATRYTVHYTLTITGRNQADVEVKVSGAPGPSTELSGEWMGSNFPAVGAVTVTNSAGRSLPFAWTGHDRRNLQVQNENSTEFAIRYAYDALRTIDSRYQQVVFEPKTVLFIADKVFLIPTVEPASITVRVKAPAGTRVFASLPEENGEFIATRDLWGDLRYDFGKTYFTGGTPLFVLDHRTAWGDLYRYIWFDRDATSMMWLPSYGNAPWEEAAAYLAMAERLGSYLREHVMEPLPPHVVLFTDARRAEDSSHAVLSNWDFFHYMQIWPRDSEGEVAHHLLHAYTFHPRDQSKLSLESSGFRLFLREGLPTYFELTVPAVLSGEERHRGKLFEFWALEQRGRPFGIQANTDFHVKYNLATMRVYLLDRYIQRVTGGARDITDFTRAMWDVVKDRKAPAEFTEADALSAFARVVGTANQDYIRQVDAQQEFPAADFTPLLPAFREYVQWMADRWFAGSPLLFLAYLDIAAAKGGTWPHYATYPHRVPFDLSEAMVPFWQHLQGSTYTQDGVLAALHAATGQNHKGFFEFWSTQGFALDPNSLRSVRNWDPGAPPEGDRMPAAHGTGGSLETVHHLSGVPQPAAAVLDAPAPDSTVLIQVTLSNPERVPPIEEAKAALSGDNVTLRDSYLLDWRGETYVRAFFRVTTTDPERRRFPFTLTMPSALSYPSFQVMRVENVPDRGLGSIYFLPPIPPLNLDLKFDAAARKLTLPDVSLPGAQFVITDGGDTHRAAPGATVQVKSEAPRVDLLDGYGFLRGRQTISSTEPPPASEPPAAPPFASPPAPAERPISVTLNGRPLVFDVDPALVNGRLLVPVRALGEALGATVSWDEASQTAVLTRGEKVIRLTLGQAEAFVSGRAVLLDVPAERRGGRVLVPLRFIAETLDLDVRWDEATQTAVLTTR